MGIYKASSDNHKQYPTRFCLPSHLNRLDLSSLINIDNTELDGLDDLANPTGIIAELEGKLARLFKTPHLHITTNGATGANLAALGHIAQNHDRITIQRDSHISLYRALALHDITPAYLPPLTDENFTEKLNKNTGNSALWLTTPIYDGTGLDREIIKGYSYIHIDSALGSLLPVFGYHDYTEIADSTTYSGHKGFPALTQTGFLAAKNNMREVLNIYNSTSPSYILLASIEKALEYIELDGKSHWERLSGYKERIIKECGIDAGSIRDSYFSDPMKLTIKNVDGFRLYDELLRRGIVVENCGADFITLFFSILHEDCDTEHFIRGYNDIKLKYPELFEMNYIENIYMEPIVELSPYQAKRMSGRGRAIELSHSAGQISNTMVYLYPPGTPLLMPGERITTDIIEYIDFVKSLDYNIIGLNEGDRVDVL